LWVAYCSRSRFLRHTFCHSRTIANISFQVLLELSQSGWPRDDVCTLLLMNWYMLWHPVAPMKRCTQN
jgi:hypothetical protein